MGLGRSPWLFVIAFSCELGIMNCLQLLVCEQFVRDALLFFRLGTAMYSRTEYAS